MEEKTEKLWSFAFLVVYWLERIFISVIVLSVFLISLYFLSFPQEVWLEFISLFSCIYLFIELAFVFTSFISAHKWSKILVLDSFYTAIFGCLHQLLHPKHRSHVLQFFNQKTQLVTQLLYLFYFLMILLIVDDRIIWIVVSWDKSLLS